MKEAGVYVVEMCKEVFQPELEGITILNLWHGVGCKSIERKVTGGFLQERIAKKYIRNNRIYKNAQLFLVTSELMEKHFMEQCGIDEELLIRAGYPRCTVTDPVCTYPHDIRAIKGLSDDARIVVYAPTCQRLRQRKTLSKLRFRIWTDLRRFCRKKIYYWFSKCIL